MKAYVNRKVSGVATTRPDKGWTQINENKLIAQLVKNKTEHDFLGKDIS